MRECVKAAKTHILAGEKTLIGTHADHLVARLRDNAAEGFAGYLRVYDRPYRAITYRAFRALSLHL